MAIDTNLTHGAPGIASFATESFGGPGEPRFGDGDARTITIPVTATGAALDLDLYSVVSYDVATGVLALATMAGGPPAVSNAYGILAMPVVMAEDQEMDVEIYVSGHWDMDQLVWAASFDTEAERKHAFEGGAHPAILVSKKKFQNSAINI